MEKLLHDDGLAILSNYMLDLESGGCFRTQVALRILCCTREQWEQFLYFEAGEEFAHKVRGFLVQILGTFLTTIHQTLKDIRNLDID
jgi:hypothetical protein